MAAEMLLLYLYLCACACARACAHAGSLLAVIKRDHCWCGAGPGGRGCIACQCCSALDHRYSQAPGWNCTGTGQVCGSQTRTEHNNYQHGDTACAPGITGPQDACTHHIHPGACSQHQASRNNPYVSRLIFDMLQHSNCWDYLHGLLAWITCMGLTIAMLLMSLQVCSAALCPLRPGSCCISANTPQSSQSSKCHTTLTVSSTQWTSTSTADPHHPYHAQYLRSTPHCSYST